MPEVLPPAFYFWGAALAALHCEHELKRLRRTPEPFLLRTVAQLKLCVGYWMVRLTLALADPAGVVVSGNVVVPVTVKASAPLDDAEVLASPR